MGYTNEFSSRFASLRESYEVHLTDHEFQAVAQTTGREVICTPTSQTGRALVRQMMAEVKGENVVLTASGEALRNHLRTFENVYFGPDGLINLVLRWWNRRLLRLERAKRASVAPLKVQQWTEADEQRQLALWQQGISAFWLCPDGIDDGIRLHDEYLATGKLPARAIPAAPTLEDRITRLISSGCTVPAVAKAVGKSQEFVADVWEARHGVRLATYTPAQTIEQIIALNDLGKSKAEIAVAMGRSEAYVTRILRKHRKALDEQILEKLNMAKAKPSFDVADWVRQKERAEKEARLKQRRRSYYTSSSVPAARDVGIKQKPKAVGGDYFAASREAAENARRKESDVWGD